MAADGEAFLRGLAGAMPWLESEGFKVLDGKADRVVNAMKRYAPVSDDDAHPHRLIDSIDKKPGQDKRGPYIDVGSWGAGVVEAFYQEWGTSKMDAHPWARPALAEVFGSIADYGQRGTKRRGGAKISRVHRGRGFKATAG